MHTLKVAVSADNLASEAVGRYKSYSLRVGNAGNVWLLVIPCKTRFDL